MQRIFFSCLLLMSGLSLHAQDFMLQGWYWEYDKDGCNGFSGPNWTTQLNGRVSTLADAGFTYVWLPPLSRASFGACSNGYDPKDLYDLGEFGLGRTGFGTRAEVDALIANLNVNGIDAVADVVYNHRDGGDPEDNPAVKAYVETHFNGNGKQPFPSDRYRLRLPLGGTYGAGEYYIKISSKTESYGANIYKFYATVESRNNPFLGAVNESEPNGGGDCGQPFNEVLLDQDMIATLFDFSGCYTDEFKLTITESDFDATGDNLLISLNNTNGYSDHRIYDIYYQPASGALGFNIDLNDLKFQTFTDFTSQPSGQGGMNFENFRPNSANTSTTFMAGDFDSPLFFYDVVQEEPSTRTVYSDWSEWLMT
ncbi:MAG: alpha-amylase family glycosyl hydrolase, partial [Bacteroidota bacterium]